MTDHTPYQRKVIKRYYRNLDAVKQQRLGELVADLYLATGKKRDRLWESAAAALQHLEIEPARIETILAQKDPAQLAELVREIEREQSS